MVTADMLCLSTASHTAHHAAHSAHPGLVSTAASHAAHHPTMTHPSHSTSMLPSGLHSLMLGMFLSRWSGVNIAMAVRLLLIAANRQAASAFFN